MLLLVCLLVLCCIAAACIATLVALTTLTSLLTQRTQPLLLFSSHLSLQCLSSRLLLRLPCPPKRLVSALRRATSSPLTLVPSPPPSAASFSSSSSSSSSSLSSSSLSTAPCAKSRLPDERRAAGTHACSAQCSHRVLRACACAYHNWPLDLPHHCHHLWVLTARLAAQAPWRTRWELTVVRPHRRGPRAARMHLNLRTAHAHVHVHRRGPRATLRRRWRRRWTVHAHIPSLS